MNNEQLKIAKKIAEIEGVVFKTAESNGLKSEQHTIANYKPFSWKVLAPLQLKHEVEIDYIGGFACIFCADERGLTRELACVRFKSKNEIPRAILECIIKSKEK